MVVISKLYEEFVSFLWNFWQNIILNFEYAVFDSKSILYTVKKSIQSFFLQRFIKVWCYFLQDLIFANYKITKFLFEYLKVLPFKVLETKFSYPLECEGPALTVTRHGSAGIFNEHPVDRPTVTDQICSCLSGSCPLCNVTNRWSGHKMSQRTDI